MVLTHVKAGREPAEVNQEPCGWGKQGNRTNLLDILQRLGRTGYDFIAPTPATHQRVISRPDKRLARTITDVLGWSLPVAAGVLPQPLEEALVAASVLTKNGSGLLVPQLRVSRVDGTLFWHSAYPTTAHDAVFLGPDSYRFAQLILAQMNEDVRMILDYGAGAGVGGIVAARLARGAKLTIADINPKALFLASINAEYAGVEHDTVIVSRPAEVQGRFDLMVAHPPFMIDAEGRAYRDGGDLYGAALSRDWVVEGADLLAPGGQLIMHTGVSIVRGEDVLLSALRSDLPAVGFSLDYRELDPDIFGDELDKPAYADVDRIAAVGAVLTKAPA